MDPVLVALSIYIHCTYPSLMIALDAWALLLDHTFHATKTRICVCVLVSITSLQCEYEYVYVDVCIY